MRCDAMRFLRIFNYKRPRWLAQAGDGCVQAHGRRGAGGGTCAGIGTSPVRLRRRCARSRLAPSSCPRRLQSARARVAARPANGLSANGRPCVAAVRVAAWPAVCPPPCPAAPCSRRRRRPRSAPPLRARAASSPPPPKSLSAATASHRQPPRPRRPQEPPRSRPDRGRHASELPPGAVQEPTRPRPTRSPSKLCLSVHGACAAHRRHVSDTASGTADGTDSGTASGTAKLPAAKGLRAVSDTASGTEHDTEHGTDSSSPLV